MPPKHEDAKLILQLYDLRREKVMREARAWVAGEFHPTSADDIVAAQGGEHGAHLRMVMTYWDMACALVLQGAIDAEIFHATNGEHMYVFAKLQPFLPELRKKTNRPAMLSHFEKVVMARPQAQEILDGLRAMQQQARAAQGR